MAVGMAPRGPEESLKESQERRQAAEVSAWIEVDKDQKSAEAQIAALNAQPGGLTTEQISAREENEEKVRVALKRKADIEYLWVHELKCPLKRLFAEIEKSVAKERTERLVAATNRPDEGRGTGTREQVQDLKAQTLLDATQALLDNKLLPQDLKGGENQKRAAGLVRPDLAAELPSAEATAELSAYADQIQPIYDRQALYYEAARDMEKGVVVGKAGETLKEAISNPSRLGAGVAALVGLGLLYHVFKDNSPSDGLKKWVMGILGVGAVAIGGYGAVRGLDVFNTATGIRMDDMLSSDSMKTVRKELEARMGTKESGVIDDMMRVFDSPIENYSEAYLVALRSHSDGIEKERLAGNKGLSADEMGYANNKFLKQGGDWLFMQCYEMALKDGKTTALTDDKSKRAAGAQYAKTEFAGLKVGSILVAIDMTAAGVGLKPAVSETRVTDPHLRELEAKDDAFAKVLEGTDKPDVYLINGYPVRYNYTDGGGHTFTSLLAGGITLPPVAKALDAEDESDRDGLRATLLRISKQTELEARAVYARASGVVPLSSSDLKYNGHGDWLLPPQERTTHAGLPGYLTGPNDPKVPVVLYYDTAANAVKIGIDKDGDGVPEKRATPYATVKDVAEEFEKTILHDRIVADTSRTLLMPFTVDSFSDVPVAPATATDTEVHITYGGGAKGKIIYTANKIASYTLDAPVDADLSAKWTAKATDVCKLKVLGDPRVQAALLRGTTSYTGYNPGKIAGLVSKFVGLAKDGVDWFGNDSIQEAFEDDWEKQIVKKMTDMLYDPVGGLSAEYVKDVFGTFPSNASFQTVEDTFINKQVTSISGVGVVAAPVVPEKEPDYQLTRAQAMEMVNDVGPEGGTGMIRAALEPLKSEVPAQMPSLFQEAYQGMKNLFTDDAVRTEWFDKRVSDAVIKLAKAVTLLPTPVTRDAVEREIEKAVVAAQVEALSYHGLNNQDAVEKLLLAPAEHAQPEWKAASELVASYVTNNMKWEKYAFIPNPENMAEIMDLWYKRVGTTDLNGASTGMGAVLNHPKQFAEYFIWELQARMGGRQDFSPEYFYGEVQSVSDTNFNGMITSLRSGVQPYSVWKASPELRPPTPDMLPSIDLHRKNLEVRFDKWFNDHADVGALLKLDHYWPQVFEGNVRDRFAQIIKDPSATIATLDRDVKAFTEWVWVERWMVMEPLMLNRVEAERKGFDIRVKIFNKFPWFFYPAANRTANYPNYVMMVKSQMQDIMSSHHTFPNMPGVPFL